MVTQEELKKLLHYDQEVGVFTWISKPNRKIKLGSVAGRIFKSGSGKNYIRIKINNREYLAHRLAFLYTNGSFPEQEVDHMNGNGTDNRLCNLRMVTSKENCKNLRITSANKSGVCGVLWNKKSNKWQSYICLDRKMKHLGFYSSIFDAACARKSAELIYNFHKNHGSARPLY